MSTAVLLLLACLDAEPTRCRHFEVVVERCALPMPLWTAANAWSLDHPGWTLTRVKSCQDGQPA